MAFDIANLFQNSDILGGPVIPEPIFLNKTFSSLNQSTPSVSAASTSNSSDKSIIYNFSIKSRKNVESEPKQVSSKRIYDGLATLNNKRLTKTNNSSKFEEEINDIKIKKSKIDPETVNLNEH